MGFAAEVLFLLPGLVIGITIHEAAHALSAKWLGDKYPQRLGRISLNPLRHLSIWGTLALFVLGFGWGKPVPVNLYNFKRPKLDYFLCSIAGPVSNLLLCAVLGVLILLNPGRLMVSILIPIFTINLILAVINLIPIPPLDGSKIWPCVIPGMRPVISGKWSTFWVVVLLIGLYSGMIDKVMLPVMNQTQWILSNIRNNSPRPDGFPEVLIAPKKAYQKIYWAYPENSSDPNDFIIGFKIAESYPAQNLISFLEDNLSQNQFRPLAYQLSDPNKPADAHWQLENNGDPNLGSWKKGWINNQGEIIVVEINYELNSDSKYISQRPIVYFCLYKDFPKLDLLLEYKSKHPEEFEHNE